MKLKTILVETVAIGRLLKGEETAPLSDVILDNYRQQLQRERTCAPLSVCFDGQHYWLFDGYHRIEAMNQLGFNACKVIIYKGSRRDAYRRYIKDKLRAKEPAPQIRVFRHCLARLKSDKQWAVMDPDQLGTLFGRKPAFFENLQMWDPDKGNRSLAFSISKHGSATLAKRYRA